MSQYDIIKALYHFKATVTFVFWHRKKHYYPSEKGFANHSSWAKKLAHSLLLYGPQATKDFYIVKGLKKNQKRNNTG